jgi:hypothetical protein
MSTTSCAEELVDIKMELARSEDDGERKTQSGGDLPPL